MKVTFYLRKRMNGPQNLLKSLIKSLLVCEPGVHLLPEKLLQAIKKKEK